MPTWLTAVTAALKLLGFADAALRMVQDWEQRKQGKVQQQNADLNTTQASEREAADAKNRVATDADYARKLRDRYTDPGSR